MDGVDSILRKFPIAHGNSVNCLEAMRAQSPPRHSNAGMNQSELDQEEEEEEKNGAAYRLWQLHHPSAVTDFSSFASMASGKRLAVFLDYDGTLSPIVEDPSKAYMSEEMRSAVRAVAQHFPTAIISGRSREKVYEFVQLAELYYAGSHGMDITGPRKGQAANGSTTAGVEDEESSALFLQPASKFYPTMNEVYACLTRATSPVSGALVENNKFCISVHFRRVQEQDWERLADITADVMKDFPQLHTTHGRKVLEIRPHIDWDKGKALSYLLKSLGLDAEDDVLPIYIGDDRTDEDAFSVLKDRNAGYGILVSAVAKSTKATYSLRDPSEVMIFLKKLVEWKESQ